jgi:predicted  nucleic acid-binding Zn-ribbon protein
MGEISLDMIGKRLDDIQAEQKAMRADLQKGFATLTEKVEGMAQTLVSVRRDVRTLQGDVATLSVAVDGHSRRLERIEQRLGLTESQH